MSIKLDVIGVLNNCAFIFCADLSNQLKTAGYVAEISIRGQLEFNWNLYLQQQKSEWGEEAWSLDGTCVILLDGQILGGLTQLVTWAHDKFGYVSERKAEDFETEARENYLKYITDENRRFVFFELNCDGKQMGKLVFELKTQLCPKSSDNFLKLCSGVSGKKGEVALCYQDSILHRMLPNGWVQGGDIVDGSGENSISALGVDVFEDESFAVPHDRRGVLGYANKGPHTNGSQFYITLQPTHWMDRTYVAFGQLVEGTDLLTTLESVETYNQRPKKEIRITKCGLYTGK